MEPQGFCGFHIQLTKGSVRSEHHVGGVSWGWSGAPRAGRAKSKLPPAQGPIRLGLLDREKDWWGGGRREEGFMLGQGP